MRWLILFIVILTNQAQAAERFELLQITCLPEFDFYSIKPMTLEWAVGKSEYYPAELSAQKRQREQKLYLVRNIEGYPKIAPFPPCQLDDKTFTIKTGDFMSNRIGQCESFKVTVNLNDHPIYSFTAINSCPDFYTNTFTIVGDFLQECKTNNPGEFTADMKCKKSLFYKKDKKAYE